MFDQVSHKQPRSICSLPPSLFLASFDMKRKFGCNIKYSGENPIFCIQQFHVGGYKSNLYRNQRFIRYLIPTIGIENGFFRSSLVLFLSISLALSFSLSLSCFPSLSRFTSQALKSLLSFLHSPSLASTNPRSILFTSVIYLVIV